MDVSRQTSNLFGQAYSTITEVRDKQLKYINGKLEEAKQAGKDAEACLNAVSAKMTSAAKTGYSEVDVSLSQAKKASNDAIQEFKKLKTTGQQLTNRLDRISLECYSSDIQQMGNCMITKLALVNMDIRQYQQTVSQMESSLSETKRNIIQQQRSSNQSATSKVQSVSISTIYDAADCLKR
ncbi:uncharacterized protein LOC108627081 [Ceratina calcarata]|uniref:Uncharacterized protein LOC108627081 n=1 Tax=Ceratina calcarata TaxID=156304 RepID=A0AAJ7N9J3_9HYME|nr:uncharacterized protein LOC108627081 [Ceratina calcarata]